MVAVAASAFTTEAVRLEYRLAFDTAIAQLAGARAAGEQVLVVASSAGFVDEALLRVDPPLIVATEWPSLAETARRRAWTLGRPKAPSAEVMLGHDLKALPAGSCRGAIWASPQLASWRTIGRTLARALADGGLLTILTAGQLGSLLSPVRSARSVGEPIWLGGEIDRELAELRFRPERACGLGGPASLRWALLSRVARKLGRPDLVDRAEAAYRHSLVRSWSPGLATFGLLTFVKAGRR
jgi:hypothetical protein